MFVTNKDSLSQVTMQIYANTDEFLREDGQEGDVKVDTSNKTISAGRYYINITGGRMEEISGKIENLRTLIIH